MTPENREQLRLILQEYATGTIDEWMRRIDDPDLPGLNAPYGMKIRWTSPVDGVLIASLSESGYGDEYGRYGVTVTVETLPDLPPEGPETDSALVHENEESQWYPRTYADVCTGDTIRHTPTAPPAKVLSCSIEARHVKDGGTGKHWDDAAVEHMLTRVRLDYPGSDPEKILDIPSALPVEILLTAEEFRAIELLGWGNRL
jgi:hypothetical protein